MPRIKRRNFLGALGAAPLAWAQNSAQRAVSIVATWSEPAVQWAARELQQALTGAGVYVSRHESINQAGANDLCIVARSLTDAHHESFQLSVSKSDGRQVLYADAGGALGAVYALLELADRVRHAATD